MVMVRSTAEVCPFWSWPVCELTGIVVTSQPWRPPGTLIPRSALWLARPNDPCVSRLPVEPLICEQKKLSAGLFGPESCTNGPALVGAIRS